MKTDSKVISALKIAAIAAVGAFLQAFGIPSEVVTILASTIGF